MAKTKTRYQAQVKRNELDGKLYHPGDITTLEGLSAAQIAYVVGRGYYAALDEMPEDIASGAALHEG